MITSETEELRQLVEKYALCWSATLERAVIHDELHPIGRNLVLRATHGKTTHEPTPGCDECPPVVDALGRVARFILPTEARLSHYEVHIPPATIQFSHAHPGVAEMTAVITILHNEGINQPIDACEDRCLADMTSKLRELGARERQ